MSTAIVAEALARVEYKLDILLKSLRFLDSTPIPPMHFIGQTCPVCGKNVDYQVDVTQAVVVRKCGCSTGKLPSLIPLVPVVGTSDGNASGTPGQPPEEQNRHRR